MNVREGSRERERERVSVSMSERGAEREKLGREGEYSRHTCVCVRQRGPGVEGEWEGGHV